MFLPFELPPLIRTPYYPVVVISMFPSMLTGPFDMLQLATMLMLMIRSMRSMQKLQEVFLLQEMRQMTKTQAMMMLMMVLMTRVMPMSGFLAKSCLVVLHTDCK